MTATQSLIKALHEGSRKALARCISVVENNLDGSTAILQSLNLNSSIPIIGITGPPGAGKSSLIAALTKEWISQHKKVGVIAVDPSSPFNRGALMGDRVRMSEHFLHPDIYIRSMASRGSLGGLSPKIFETADVMKAAGFDYIIIETVGVGQSEVEIAALADTTVLVLVPEAGDEIQTIKSGVMEIADIYVLNKADREGADAFYKNLHMLAHEHATNEWEAPVVKTIATKNEGIAELTNAIDKHFAKGISSDKKVYMLAEKALNMIKVQRTADISIEQLQLELAAEMGKENFNLYRYVSKYKS